MPKAKLNRWQKGAQTRRQNQAEAQAALQREKERKVVNVLGWGGDSAKLPVDSDRSLKLHTSQPFPNSSGGQVGNIAAPAPPKQTSYTESTLNQVAALRDAMDKTRTRIAELRNQLNETDPREPSHLNTAYQIVSEWHSYHNLTQDFLVSSKV